MPNYDLDRLGDKEFERMCQSLLKLVIGSGTITFGEGRDGGREATFSGKASYPSQAYQWEGEWIFQAKYHNVKLVGIDEARKLVLSDLRNELDKITNKYKYHCDNYILITNVPLSSVAQRGTHDRIALEVAPEFAAKIPHIHVWGADELYRFLERFPDLRRSYLHFITPGDLIAELMDRVNSNKSRLAESIRLYLRTCFNQEQYAQLDQAGEVGEDRMPLQRVFIDLDVTPRYVDQASLYSLSVPPWLMQAAREKKAVSAMRVLLHEATSKTTLIGGPGQGKSTLGQYLAQIHRATLLDYLTRLSDAHKLIPLVARLPFRVILKEYAQWILDTKSEQGLEFYLASNVKERAAREITANEIQEIIKNNPCLLILDGLDEVTDRNLRTKMLDQIGDFLGRCEDILNADIQVIGTSRPTGYSNQFDPAHFFHLNLNNLTPEKVSEYVDRWVTAKVLDKHKATQLKNSMKECAEDRQVQLLMNTPLQVTILVLIILSGGTPPKQREGLFDEYLEVIYKREKTKAKWIIQTEKPILFGLHKYLGYVLHSSATGDSNVLSSLKEPAFIKEAREYLRFNDPFSPSIEIDHQIDLILKEARDRLVLIVELTSGDFGFELRSLQEFFAAGHLTDTAKNSIQRYERFEAIARSVHWRNVALFFAGRVGRAYEGEAANILEVCKDIDRQEHDVYLRRGAWLALDLASDRSFGPNRKLQRSLIEYCLPVLETDINEEQIKSFQATISRIPPEDIRDHLRPVLEEKLQKVQLPYLESYLDIFFSNFGASDILLGILDTYIKDENSDYVQWGVSKALYYEVAPAWLSERFKMLLGTLTPSTFAELFYGKLLTNPKYLKACFSDNEINLEQITALLDKAFSEQTFAYTAGLSPSQLTEITSDVSSPREQLWTSIALLNFFNIFTEEFRYRNAHGRMAYDRRFVSQSNVEQLAEEIRSHRLIKADLDSISELCEREDLLLQTRAVFWALQVIISPDSSKSIKGFLDFYEGNKAKGPWINQLYRRLSFSIHPQFWLLLENIDYHTPNGELIIDLLTNRNKYEPGVQSFFSTLEDLMRRYGMDVSQYIKKVTTFGQEVIQRPPYIDLNTIERSTGVPIEVGLSLLQYGLPHVPETKLSAKEIYLILNKIRHLILRSADSSQVLSMTWSLFNSNWEVDGNLPFIINEILTHVAKTEIDDHTLGAIIAICLKQIVSGMGNSETTRLLLLLVGKNLTSDFLTPGLWEVKPTSKVLAELAPYVVSEDPTVQNGAVRLASNLIRELEEGRKYFYGSPERIDRFYKKAIFSSKVARKYVEDPEPVKRVDGIRLLLLSDFKVNEDSDWIFSSIKSCEDSKEAAVWAFFIQNARIALSAKALRLWITNSISVLKDRDSYHPTIRRAVLETYDRLIRHREAKFKLNESALDLPLNRDLPR